MENCLLGLKRRENKLYSENIKPGVLRESAEEPDRISHLIFYQNLYLSRRGWIYRVRCVEVFSLLYPRIEINIKWQKRFYEELLPFYCFCNGGGFIKLNEGFMQFPR